MPTTLPNPVGDTISFDDWMRARLPFLEPEEPTRCSVNRHLSLMSRVADGQLAQPPGIARAMIRSNKHLSGAAYPKISAVPVQHPNPFLNRRHQYRALSRQELLGVSDSPILASFSR